MSNYRLIQSEMKNKVNFQLWHEPESYRWRINVIISRSTALNYDSVYTYHCPTRLVRLQVA
jgi:hypothetical protein